MLGISYKWTYVVVCLLVWVGFFDVFNLINFYFYFILFYFIIFLIWEWGGLLWEERGCEILA